MGCGDSKEQQSKATASTSTGGSMGNKAGKEAAATTSNVDTQQKPVGLEDVAPVISGAGPALPEGKGSGSVQSLSVSTAALGAGSSSTHSPPASPGGGAHFEGPKRAVIHNNPEDYRRSEGEAEPAAVPKSEAERAVLSSALKHHFLFSDLDDNTLTGCIDVMPSLLAKGGTNIITQGERGDVFYVLEAGAADVLVNDDTVASYGPGSSFGELALMYSCQRAATIKATEDCKLWTMSLRSFRRLLASSASQKMLEVCEFLRCIPLLADLSNDKLTKLADAMEVCHFAVGEYIIREGDQGDRFFIIRHGAVKCTAKRSPEDDTEVHLTTMESGNYFGEMALLMDEPRNANCIASGDETVECLSLDRQKFFTLLGPIQDVLLQNMRLRVLRSVPLLNKLTDEELDAVANALFVESFEDGQYVIQQGDKENTSRFYIINEGVVSITINAPSGEEEVSRLQKGDYFGEGALLKDEPRSANVLAMGFVDCLVLERTDFNTLLGPLEAILKRETVRRREKGKAFESLAGPSLGGDSRREKKPAPALQNLQTIKILGTGTFGRVKLVRDVKSENLFALKCMLKVQIAKSHQQRNIMNEKEILMACNFPFIMELLGTYNTRDELLILSELLLGGELWAYIYNKKLKMLPRTKIGGFEPDAARFYAGTVILCLQYLHGRKVAYRDLKPENLVLTSAGFVKMIDFGFAKHIPFKRGGTDQPKSFTLCGTPDYLAPELVLSRGHDKSVDLWALGVFTYELLLGKTPFASQSQSEVFKQIVRSERSLRFPNGFDLVAEDLVRKLLAPNVAFRLGNTSGGINDVLDHPWFKTFKWDDMREMKVPPPFVPKISKNWDKPPESGVPKSKAVPYHGNQKIFEGF